MFAILNVAPQSAVNFAPIFLGIVAVLGLLGALKGFTRGMPRQFIRTATIVAAAVISFFVAKGIYAGISNFLSDKTMSDIEELLIKYNVLSAESDNSWLQNLDIGTLLLIATVPLALVIMPVAFVVCFVTISGILLIVHALLCGLLGFRKRGNGLISRLLGMALGLVQGIAVAGLLLMPVIGIGNMVSDTVEVIRQDASEGDDSQELVEMYDYYVKSATENPASKALGACGINSLYKSIATVEIDGQKTDMTALIPDVTKIAEKIASLKGMDFVHITPENESAITEMFDLIEKNPYLTRVLAGTVKMFSYAYENGVAKIEATPPLDTLLDSTVEIFHTSDATNIHSDIDTVCEVIFILSRDGVLAAFESGSNDMMAALTKRDENGVTTVKKVINTINKNERTKSLTAMLTNLSVSVMRDATGLDESTMATGESLKSSINAKTMKIKKSDYASEDEYVAAVSDSLDETLKENNISIEKSVVDNMAKYIADNYGDKDEISDEEANDILLYYFDAHLQHTENQEQN